MALKQLLHAQQQDLLSDQQPLERQQHHRQQKERNHVQTLQIKKSVRDIPGLHSDDNQDSTISQLMQALPEKKYPSIKVDLDDRCNEGELQHRGNEEFEEDIDDLIDDEVAS